MTTLAELSVLLWTRAGLNRNLILARGRRYCPERPDSGLSQPKHESNHGYLSGAEVQNALIHGSATGGQLTYL